MNHRHLILCLLATLTSMDAAAWSRMAEAEISSFKGMPCFTISKKKNDAMERQCWAHSWFTISP